MERYNKITSIIIALLLIAIGSTDLIARDLSIKKANAIKKETEKYVAIKEEKEEKETRKNELQVDFASLKAQNEDTVGYIEVNGTEIQFSVVQSTDNEYYLRHDFNKNYSRAGWPFADYRNKFDGTDKNIIIYGHNMRDGSMFHSLTNVLTEEWYTNEDNLYIPFSTETENMLFKVFSIYQIEPEDYYIETEFSGNEFFAFTSIIKSRSIYDFKAKINKDDMILTLSTCTNDGKQRIVVHSVRVS